MYTGLFPGMMMELTSHHILGPTWMDDLCISIVGETAQAVEHRAGLAASVLLETCLAHGVTPNLDRGKSEVLFTFRGQGSRPLRLKYFGMGRLWANTPTWATHTIQAHRGGRFDATSALAIRPFLVIVDFSSRTQLFHFNDELSSSPRWCTARLLMVWNPGSLTPSRTLTISIVPCSVDTDGY